MYGGIMEHEMGGGPWSGILVHMDQDPRAGSWSCNLSASVPLILTRLGHNVRFRLWKETVSILRARPFMQHVFWGLMLDCGVR